MGIQAVKVVLQGATPLMMHNSQLANPFNPFTLALQELNKDKKRKGTDTLATLRKMARMEWEGGLHYAEDVGPYLPGEMIRSALVAGARVSKGGKAIERTVSIPEARFPLQYKGPRAKDELWAAGDKIQEGWDAGTSFVDQRMARVTNAMVLRTRPIFKEWSAKVTIHFIDDGPIKRDDLIRYLKDAGQFEGVGDGRRLGFGRFNVQVM